MLGGGIDFDTGEKVADEYRVQPRPRPRAPTRRKSIVIAPLMHGAAQWGTFGSLFNGKTLVLMPKFDADEVWKAIEKHRITGVEHHRRRDGAPARSRRSTTATTTRRRSSTIASTAAVFSRDGEGRSSSNASRT